MRILVFDTESDGLYKDATKLHVMSWTWDGYTYTSTDDYSFMKEILHLSDLAVCHNSIRHDLPLLNKFTNAGISYKDLADTQALSWYLNFKRPRHGLATFEKEYGIKKPKVEDWNNLTYEEYAHRCEEDVKLTWHLWSDLHSRLVNLYGNEDWKKLVRYLSFKMDCAREQEECGWRLDVDKAKGHYEDLSRQFDEKVSALSKAMPKKPLYRTMAKPKVIHKQDGTLSVSGLRWYRRLRNAKLPIFTHSEPVRYIYDYEPGNPNSTDQVKSWLFSLGWKPRTFKYVKDEDGEETTERAIPQVRYPKNHPEEGHLCESVVELKDKEPKISILESLTVIAHRKNFFKAMLDAEEDGWVTAGVNGFTNTLRFKHTKPLANIPGVDKPWGKEIRGCLISPDENHILCGADMSSLESTTKRHYMKPYDPKYVEEMSDEDFDEHLDIALRARYISESDLSFWNTFNEETPNERYKKIAKIRKTFKPVNYGSVYGIGAKKLSREMGISIKEAAVMLRAYWDRNWAIKQVAKDQYIKTVDGQDWLKNPVSGIYHNLRFEKDIFSTLNQSTGVYCFDVWTSNIRDLGVKLCGQFHDEHIAPIEKGEEKKTSEIYELALDKTNKVLTLNVPLGIDIQFGADYASIH